MTHVCTIEDNQNLHLSVVLTKSVKTLGLVANLLDVILVEAPAEIHNGK